MNKEEKIGMYTDEEIFNYMTDKEGSMLGRSMYDAIANKIRNLQSQLTKSNNKIEKIKEYCKEKDAELTMIGIPFMETEFTHILSIIDGSDE